MTTVAIISEYNPFHSGHLYQIEKVREAFGDDTCIIAVMSGNFVQRGTPAIFDKYTRAQVALQSGVNLVLEFPFPFCCSGANFFARNAIDIVNKLNGVDYLAFGIEAEQLAILQELSNIICSESYEIQLKNKIKTSSKNSGFAEIRESVLTSIAPHIPCDCLRLPNNILATEYLVALKKTKSTIQPFAIQRTVDYHSQTATASGVASASHIRNLISENNIAEALLYTPQTASALYQSSYSNGFWASQDFDAFGKIILSHLRINTPQATIFECNDELTHRIKNAAYKAKNYSDLIKFSQTAHFTRARVQRAVLHILMSTPTDIGNAAPLYTQLLATDGTGMRKLKQIHRRGNIRVLTKPADTHLLCSLEKEQANLCAKADSVYSLLQPSLGAGDEFFRKSPYCVR